jgi:hypothetical protein
MQKLSASHQATALDPAGGESKYQVDVDAMRQLPHATFTGKIHQVIHASEETNAVLSVLQGAKVLGLDTETKPVFKKGITEPISLVQVCGEGFVVIYDLIQLQQIPPGLHKVLTSEKCLKVGVGVLQDAVGLSKEYG